MFVPHRPLRFLRRPAAKPKGLLFVNFGVVVEVFAKTIRSITEHANVVARFISSVSGLDLIDVKVTLRPAHQV